MPRRRNQLVRTGNRALCLTDTHIRHIVSDGDGEAVDHIPLSAIQSIRFRVASDPIQLAYGFTLSAASGAGVGLAIWAGGVVGIFLFMAAILAVIGAASCVYQFYNDLVGRLTITYPDGTIDVTSKHEPVELLEAFVNTVEEAQRELLRRAPQAPSGLAPASPSL
ncbi:MAG: hypothetical protein R3185_03475 [Candidatus Thermoplasmatota archaeon]|nr:hypothetical protein [Candidatus Thermoplasmatota archaeon]